MSALVGWKRSNSDWLCVRGIGDMGVDLAGRMLLVSVTALLLFMTPGVQAHAATVPIIGYYKLNTGSAGNLVAPGEAMTLRNAPLSSQGAYLNGVYSGLPNGSLAKTAPLPQLDVNNFATLVEFKTDKSGVPMPVLVMGEGYRSLALRIGAGSQLYVTLNNNTVSYSLAGVTIQQDRWYKAALAFDLASRAISFALDGGSVQTITLPPGFAFDIMAAGVAETTRAADANFLFTDYSNSSTFSGYIKTLIVYGRSIAADTLRQITTTLPAVPGSNITLVNPGPQVLGSGIVDITATSTIDLPITLRSTTPSICTVSGMAVTLVAEGTCTLVASQAGAAANATASFAVSGVSYRPLVRTPSGRGAYLVAQGLDLQAPLFGSAASTPGAPAIDRSKEIIRHLYATYGNYFDGIYLISNNPDPSVVQTFGYFGRNLGITSNEAGLGREPWSRSAEFGALPRLRSLIHIPSRGGILGGPALHEFLHNWANAGFIANPVDSGHWGYASTNGQLGGFDRNTLTQVGSRSWAANATGRTGFGTFANGGNSVPYGNVELYLMGLIPPSQLEPLMVARNPQATEAYDDIHSGFTADGFDTFSAADLIARAGARVPAADFSPKRFDILFILLSDTTPTADEISDFDSQIEQFTRQGSDWRANAYNFWEATGGRAIMIPVDIASVPPPATVVSANEALISWAEHVFPTLFPPAGRTRGQTGGYDYACYGTGLCLGLDAQRNVFCYDGHSIIPVGRAADYTGYMQAAGF